MRYCKLMLSALSSLNGFSLSLPLLLLELLQVILCASALCVKVFVFSFNYSEVGQSFNSLSSD